MGKIIELDTKKLVPIQKNLWINNIRNITEIYLSNPKKILVPVVKHPSISNRFVLLDGHHSSCVSDVFNEKVCNPIGLYGWVINGRNDFIENISPEFYNEDVLFKNINIKMHYDNIRNYLKDKNIPKSIIEMRDRYPQLKSIDSLMNFVFPNSELGY